MFLRAITGEFYTNHYQSLFFMFFAFLVLTSNLIKNVHQDGARIAFVFSFASSQWFQMSKNMLYAFSEP